MYISAQIKINIYTYFLEISGKQLINRFLFIIGPISSWFAMIEQAVPTPGKGWSQQKDVEYWGVSYALQ